MKRLMKTLQFIECNILKSHLFGHQTSLWLYVPNVPKDRIFSKTIIPNDLISQTFHFCPTLIFCNTSPFKVFLEAATAALL